MENSALAKYTVSYGLALALASVVNGLLVVAKESSPAVQAGMQKLTGHHWVTHSALVLGLFFLVGWLFARARGGQGLRLTTDRLLAILVSGVVLGGLIIVGFYLISD
jgi:hypothetical protein